MSSSLDRQGHIKISRLLITWTLFCSFISLCSAVIVTVSINGFAVEGQETRLICTIEKGDLTNTFTPSITWQEVVNGSPVTIVQYQDVPGPVQPPYDDRFTIEGDDSQLTLVIDNTMRSDDGTYECEVVVVNDPPSPASDAVAISVAFLGTLPETVTVDPATAKLNEDALMTFIFTPATGDDLVFLTWFRSDADGVTQGNSIISNITGNTVNGRYSLSYNNGGLIISNVEVEDAGHYLCRVTTATGNSVEGFSNLTVYYLETPALEPKDISATFTCPLNGGVPTPITITWIKDGDELDVSDNEKYPQSDTTLEISRVNEMDEGDYQCRAENTAYSGNEGKLSNTGALAFRCSLTSTSIASTSATMAQVGSCSNTGLVVGMMFLGIFIGILLSSFVFVVLGKMRNSKPQVTEATSRNDTQPAAYMAYRGEPNAENQTYEDLQRNDDDNPVVYVNVKVKKEKR